MTHNIMEEFEIDEISGVDNPAQVGARVTLMKRAGTSDVNKKLRLLSDEDGHTHMIDDAQDGGQTSYEHSPGEDMGHSHPWVRNDDGSLTVGMSDGHTHNVIQKTAGSAGSEDNMTNQDKSAPAGEQAVTKQQLDALQAELNKAKALAGMSDAQKAYAGTLPEAERAAFISKSDSERSAILAKAVSDDPVVYTCMDGTPVHKSMGPLAARLAKQADDSARELAIEKASRQNDALAKRAADELGNLPGEQVVKVSLLRAIEGISDAEVRKGVQALLKAANDGQGMAFKNIGAAGGDSSSSDLEGMAQKHALAKGISFEKALREVMDTPEGRELYRKSR